VETKNGPHKVNLVLKKAAINSNKNATGQLHMKAVGKQNMGNHAQKQKLNLQRIKHLNCN